MLTATETTLDEAKNQIPEEEKTVSFRLARFVAVLALSPEKLEFFLDYPDLAMNDASLPEEERALLANDPFQNLCRYLAKVGPKPTSVDPPPPPPGG